MNRLTDQELEVKQKIGILLELLGEDFEIICAINGFLDQPADDALRRLNPRIEDLQKQTGYYGPYLADPVDLKNGDVGLIMNRVSNQMKDKGVKIICKRED